MRVDSCLENGHSSGELVELATPVSFPFSFHLLFVDRFARDFLVFRNAVFTDGSFRDRCSRINLTVIRFEVYHIHEKK